METPGESATPAELPPGRSPLPVEVSTAIHLVGGVPVALVTFSTPVGESTYWYTGADLSALILVLQHVLGRLSRTVSTPPPKRLVVPGRPPLNGRAPVVPPRFPPGRG
jgi:hypothetical protein